MSSGVLYMITGSKHLNVLVVSIWSLRKSGYKGPIHIAVGDDAAMVVVRKIFDDARLTCPDDYLNLSVARWQPPNEQRGDSYRAKTFMDGLSPFESTVFLDADTVVCGDISPLFTPPEFAVTLTNFSDWKSNGRKISGRIDSWKDVAPKDVAKMQGEPLPAINTGILSWRPGAAMFFFEWRELAGKKPVFIVDELAAQLIFWRHNVRVLDSKWNASPIHDKRTDAVIYHFHGRKHVNREQGRKIWLPLYDECCRLNIAGIRDWTPGGDKRLREYLEGKHLDHDESESESAV